MIAALAKDTTFASSPTPTKTNDIRAPPTDSSRRVLRPSRCDVEGSQPGLKLLNDTNVKRRTSMRKMGGKVMIALTIVMPSETKGPRSGRALERISLL